jgi:signal transduction histidine kinase
MTQKTKAKILDPFFTTKIRGRGMGLSVVLGTVRAHGGDILVNSEQGKGTSLRIIFPAINPRG